MCVHYKSAQPFCSRAVDTPRQVSGVFIVTQPMASGLRLKTIAHTCGQHSICGQGIWDRLKGWILVCCALEVVTGTGGVAPTTLWAGGLGSRSFSGRLGCPQDGGSDSR